MFHERTRNALATAWRALVLGLLSFGILHILVFAVRYPAYWEFMTVQEHLTERSRVRLKQLGAERARLEAAAARNRELRELLMLDGSEPEPAGR